MMKSKILLLIIALAAVYSCSPDMPGRDYTSNYTVDMVVCEASSDYLVADGISQLDLRVRIYTKADTYIDKWLTKDEKSKKYIEHQRYLEVPQESWRNHDIKFFLNGSQVSSPYTTTDASAGTLRFYAEVDGTRSGQSPIEYYIAFPPAAPGATKPSDDPKPGYDPIEGPIFFDVKVRPNFEMPKRKIPVIFHVIDTKENFDRGQNIDPDAVYDIIDNLNAVYGRKNNYAPNGTNVNIEFVAALRNTSGGTLGKPGVNIVKLSEGEYTTYKANVKTYVTTKHLWNVEKYLNVWVMHEASSGTNSSYSFQKLSNYLPYNYPNGTPGVDELQLPAVTPSADDPRQYGIVIRNYQLTNNNSHVAQMVGAFLGLVPNAIVGDAYSHPYTSGTSGATWLDDYCDDTPRYNRWFHDINFGAIQVSAEGASQIKYTLDAPYYVFRSTNVMESSSYESVISQDQAKRIDLVLKNAPRRQMWRDLSAINE